MEALPVKEVRTKAKGPVVAAAQAVVPVEVAATLAVVPVGVTAVALVAGKGFCKLAKFSGSERPT